MRQSEGSSWPGRVAGGRYRRSVGHRLVATDSASSEPVGEMTLSTRGGLSSLFAFGRPGSGAPHPASHSSELFRIDRFGQKNCNTNGKHIESDHNVQESVLLNGVCAYQEDNAGQDGQRPEKSCEQVEGNQKNAVEFHITTLRPLTDLRDRPLASNQNRRRFPLTQIKTGMALRPREPGHNYHR